MIIIRIIIIVVIIIHIVFVRPSENMVGANMVLAEYHQNTLE